MTTPEQTIKRLMACHAELALSQDTDPSAAPVSDAPFDIAYTACRRMGFIDADALCVATAWARQSERLGQFTPDLWPCDPLDYGLTANKGFDPCPHALGLYAVLPSAVWVGRMACAGVPTVQLRFKCHDRRAIRREVQAAVRAVAGTASLLFINDHWQEAIEAGAYGVHLGQEDLATAHEHLHAIRHAGLRLGLSTHGYAEMMRAESFGPSYLALGAVYPTTLKRMPTAPQGPRRLAVYAKLFRHRPLVAIGGINRKRMGEVLQSGVGSVGVMRALVAAANPEAEAKHLMDCMLSAQRQT